MAVNSQLETSGSSRTSRDVSNDLDRLLLLHLRGLATLAVTDTATAQAEGYRQSKFVDIEIWTRSGDTRGFKNAPGVEDLRGLWVVQVDDPESRLSQLRSKHPAILLETGPTLSFALAKAKLIDEVCLSITQTGSEAEAYQVLTDFIKNFEFNQPVLSQNLWLQGTLFVRLKLKTAWRGVEGLESI